ncbi:methyltransferase domain-containing protein [Pseudomonadota bacterium]
MLKNKMISRHQIDSQARCLTGRGYFIKRVLNTFCHFPSLWPWVVKRRLVDAALVGDFKGLEYYIHRALQRTLWFWPRLIDARLWIEGGEGHIRTPDNFVDFDRPSQALCDAVEKFVGALDAPILDLGCNVGRHLDDLRKRGLSNLHGVDAMQAALNKMAEVYPSTHEMAQLKHDLFQSYLMDQASQSFDIVYTHGATVELVHPSFDIVRHVCRVTQNYVILIQNEILPNGYPRFWHYEFARHGFHLRAALRPIGAYPDVKITDPEIGNNMSLLIFQRHQD